MGHCYKAIIFYDSRVVIYDHKNVYKIGHRWHPCVKMFSVYSYYAQFAPPPEIYN